MTTPNKYTNRPQSPADYIVVPTDVEALTFADMSAAALVSRRIEELDEATFNYVKSTLKVKDITREEMLVMLAIHTGMELSDMSLLPRLIDRESGARIDAKIVVSHKREGKVWDKKKRKWLTKVTQITIAEMPLYGVIYDAIKTAPLSRIGYKPMDTKHWTKLSPTKSTENDYKYIMVPDKSRMTVTEYFNKYVKRVCRNLAFPFIHGNDEGNNYDIKIIVKRKF